MSGEITLRDYTHADREQVLALMEEIYDPVVMANSRRHWAWQYHDNPRNPDGQPAIRVVDRGGEIVATICGIRQTFWLEGRVTPGLWVVDFMARQAGTSQKERHRFGQRLAFELRDTQPLVAGVNRPALNRYWKRILGDQVDICAVPMMIRLLKASNLLRRRVKNPALAAVAGVAGQAVMPLVFRGSRRRHSDDVTFDKIESFDDRFDRFWKRTAPTFRCISVRDTSFMQWRYADIPDRDYECHAAQRDGEMMGWIITRVVEDGELRKGRIVDILAPQDDLEIWHFLLSRAVDRFRELDADLVHGLGSTSETLMQAYRECGFRKNPEHARTAQYIAYNNLDGIDQDAFYDGDNWFVTFGDTDSDFATPE